MTTTTRKPFVYDDNEYMLDIINQRKTGHLWFYFPTWNLSLLTPAKCGTSSVKQFIWMNRLEEEVKRLKHHEVTGEVFSTVREPVSRFCSLWRSKCRDKANLRDKRIHGMTPTELMTHIESGAKDIHWTLQSDMIVNLDLKLIPLKMFGFWWKQGGLGQLGRYNETVGDVNIDDDLKKRILTFYDADRLLHNKAECDFCWDTPLKLNIQ